MARVLIPLAEGFEEMEAVIVIDVLRRGGVEVVTAGLHPGPVQASRRTVLLPDTDLDAAMGQEYDMIILVGGMPGVSNLHDDPRIQTLLERFRNNNGFTAAICAAPSILAGQGLLTGRKATGNPKFRAQVALPGVDYCEQAVVIDGTLITSRGPGTSIDFALALLDKLSGPDKRNEVEAGLVRPEASAPTAVAG
jgi:protein deglycase